MLTLQAGEGSLTLAPEMGGSIVGWTLGPYHVLRPPLVDALVQGSARGMAAFPLVPKHEVGFRVQVTAANTDAEVDHLITIIAALHERFPLQPVGDASVAISER